MQNKEQLISIATDYLNNLNNYIINTEIHNNNYILDSINRIEKILEESKQYITN